MKSIKTLISALMIISWATIVPAQIIMPDSNDPRDLEGMETGEPREKIWSPYGWAFTPKGNLKVLVIFAGFEDNNVGAQDPNNEDWPAHITQGDNQGLPSYVDPETGKMDDFLFENLSDFVTVIAANPQNQSISRYYHDMSMGKFRFTGEAFKDPETNKPVRINIKPGGNPPADEWYWCNKKVMEKISRDYPSFDFSVFDNRTNRPKYLYDNSLSNPDSIVDCLIFIWRYSPDWTNQPFTGMNTWGGSHGGFAGGAPGVTIGIYSFNTVYTLTLNLRDKYAVQESFVHEIAHDVFDCPHVFGANGVVGSRWHFSAGGWGMIKGSEYMVSANAWERYLLGWIDIKSNNEDADILSPEHLNKTGIYTIRDFVTYGDAIRIKIPHVESTYLWIENHQRLSAWDFKSGEGSTPSLWYPNDNSFDTIPRPEKGIYMYIDNTRYSRDSIFPALGPGANGLKALNAQGNFNYTHSTLATSNPEVFWGNVLFTFTRGEENPISGISPFSSYPDNYPNNPLGPPTYDNTILYNTGSNSAKNEAHFIIKESIEPTPRLTYAALSGLNHVSKEILGRRSDAFQEGDEVGLSGIVPILNYPKYSMAQEAIEPYILNNISVKILSFNTVDRSFQIKIDFNDNEIRSSKNWAGDIQLVKQRDDNEADVILKQGNTLRIVKSGVPNRHTKTVANDFINPTFLTLLDCAYFKQETNSHVSVEDNSSLVLKSGSTYEISDNATLHIKNNATFKMEPCSRLIIRGNGKIIFDLDTYMNIANGAVLAFERDTQNISYTLGRVIIDGINPASVLLEPRIITDHQVWENKGRLISLPIIVESGGVLEIKSTPESSVLNFYESSIIVKPGGKLILEDIRLTNVCNKQWYGIELHGNRLAPQTPEEQPVVELRNEAIIENAVFGIFAGDRNNPGVYGGGIICAEGANFKDCDNGIVMHEYRNYSPQNPNIEINNRSYIQKCTFQTTNNFDYLKQRSTAIWLWGVKGVQILGNTFTSYKKYHGNGIVLEGTKSTIIATALGENFGDKISNIFNNLESAIYILSSANTTIEENSFQNNHIAITNDGNCSGTIINNTILNPAYCGIFAFSGNNFKIMQNNIRGNNSGIGIIANRTGLQEIYKNNLSKLETGIYASENPLLKLNCNILNDNNYHLKIVKDGAHWLQGSENLPTGNQFFPECNGTNTEIYTENATSIMIYHHYDNQEHEPLCKRGVYLSPTTSINQCLDRNPNDRIPTEQELISLNEDIESGEEFLSRLVDGGDTPALVQTVEDAESGEEYNLLNDLLDKSPFLSEDVLVTTASEEEVLPNLFIANILEANPQAAKSAEVQEALDNRINQMPEYLREIINSGLDIISAKEEIEMQVAEKIWQREVLLSDLISYYLNDSTANRSAEAEALMLAENTLYYDYMMIDRYLSTQRFSQAQELFGSLPNKYNLEGSQLDEYNQMSQIVDIHVALGDGNYFNLSAEQKSILYQLAEDTESQAGSIARAILVLVDQARFPLPEITLPEEDEGKGHGSTVVQKNEFAFSINPNPAEDYFIVKYNLAAEVFESAELRLFNNKGVEVYQQQLTKPAFEILVATDKFEPGIYLCRLYDTGKEVGAKPLVIKPSQIVDSQFEDQAEQLLEGKPYFFLYPNPAKVEVTLCSSRTQDCTIEVFNERGQLVSKLQNISTTNTLHTGEFTPGIYHVRLVEKGLVVETVKLIVQ